MRLSVPKVATLVSAEKNAKASGVQQNVMETNVATNVKGMNVLIVVAIKGGSRSVQQNVKETNVATNVKDKHVRLSLTLFLFAFPFFSWLCCAARNDLSPGSAGVWAKLAITEVCLHVTHSLC